MRALKRVPIQGRRDRLTTEPKVQSLAVLCLHAKTDSRNMLANIESKKTQVLWSISSTRRKGGMGFLGNMDTQ